MVDVVEAERRVGSCAEVMSWRKEAAQMLSGVEVESQKIVVWWVGKRHTIAAATTGAAAVLKYFGPFERHSVC